jgi:hypothetical protein
MAASFRHTNDLRFGMGLSSTRIGELIRRDRLLPVSAFAMALLSLLGALGESLGMDRLLKSNTSKIRAHSPFRQGCTLYELIPNMPEQRLVPWAAAPLPGQGPSPVRVREIFDEPWLEKEANDGAWAPSRPCRNGGPPERAKPAPATCS